MTITNELQTALEARAEAPTQAAALMVQEAEQNADRVAARQMRAALKREFKPRATRRINLDIPEGVLADLDKLAEEVGCSRNTLMVRAIEWLVSK